MFWATDIYVQTHGILRTYSTMYGIDISQKNAFPPVIFLHKCRDMSFWNLGGKAEAKCLVNRNCWSCGLLGFRLPTWVDWSLNFVECLNNRVSTNKGWNQKKCRLKTSFLYIPGNNQQFHLLIGLVPLNLIHPFDEMMTWWQNLLPSKPPNDAYNLWHLMTPCNF